MTVNQISSAIKKQNHKPEIIFIDNNICIGYDQSKRSEELSVLQSFIETLKQISKS